MLMHVRSVAKQRLKEKVGRITAAELQLLVKGLNEILKY